METTVFPYVQRSRATKSTRSRFSIIWRWYHCSRYSSCSTIKLFDYGIDFIEIGLAVLLTQRADRPKTYTKTEVDDIMQAKQNTLSVIYPMNLGSRVASCPLLVGSNIIPGLSVQLPLTLTRNDRKSLMIGISTIILYQSTLSVNTLTTSSVTLNIKSNHVLF